MAEKLRLEFASSVFVCETAQPTQVSLLYLLTRGPSSGLYSTRSFATFATESSGMVVWLRRSAMSNLAAGA